MSKKFLTQKEKIYLRDCKNKGYKLSKAQRSLIFGNTSSKKLVYEKYPI